MFKKTREKSPYFLLAMDFGYTLLAGVLLLGYLGYIADKRFGTLPLFLIIGFGLGIAVGFNSLFRRLNLLETKRKANKKEDGQEPAKNPES